jgi:hypothetical protein
LARIETPEDEVPAASSRAISTSGSSMGRVYDGGVPLPLFLRSMILKELGPNRWRSYLSR